MGLHSPSYHIAECMRTYAEWQRYGSHFPAICVTSQTRSNCGKYERWHKHTQCSLLNTLFQSRKTLQHSSCTSCLADYCKALLNSPSMLLPAIRPLSLLSSDYFFQIFLHSLLHWSELSVVINSLVKSLWNPITPAKIKICHFFPRWMIKK